MDEMGWNKAQLSREIGAKNQSTVGEWMNHRNSSMDPRFAWPLQDKYRWNARWLLLGEGPERIPAPDPEKEQIIEELRQLPVERLIAIKSVVAP